MTADEREMREAFDKEYAALVKWQDRQTERNNEGIQLEKTGKTARAIALYEINIAEGFDGTHPYERLADLYREAGRREDEIRVLKRAVQVFEKVARSGRSDGQPKLDRFRQRLAGVESGVLCERLGHRGTVEGAGGGEVLFSTAQRPTLGLVSERHDASLEVAERCRNAKTQFDTSEGFAVLHTGNHATQEGERFRPSHCAVRSSAALGSERRMVRQEERHIPEEGRKTGGRQAVTHTSRRSIGSPVSSWTWRKRRSAMHRSR